MLLFRAMAARKNDVSFEVVPLSKDHVPAIMEIERRSFPYPWSRQIFLRELSYDWSYLTGCLDRVTGRLASFVNFWLVYDEIHILNVATHPDFRHQGHAAALLGHVMEFGRNHRCAYMTLEVRRSNVAALGLYDRFGFKQVGVRPRYYVEDGEDALVMVLPL